MVPNHIMQVTHLQIRATGMASPFSAAVAAVAVLWCTNRVLKD